MEKAPTAPISFAQLPLSARLRSNVRAARAAVLSALVYGGARLHMKFVASTRRQQIFDRWLVRWGRGVLSIMGTEVVTRGEIAPRSDLPRLVVGNHRTAIDIPLMLAHFAGAVVSRGDLEFWPVIGAGARAAQVVFVDKDSTSSKMRAIRAVRQRLRAGRTVSVFPEGSTFEGDEVRPFFRGSLAAARGISTEVVPVGLAYPEGSEYLEETFLEHMRRYAARSSVRIGMVVGAPIDLDALGPSPESFLRDRVQELVTEARALAR